MLVFVVLVLHRLMHLDHHKGMVLSLWLADSYIQDYQKPKELYDYFMPYTSPYQI